MILKNDRVQLELNDCIGGHIKQLTVDNQPLMWFPFSEESYLNTTQLAGNPFMHPWANRLESNFIQFDDTSIDLSFSSIYRDAHQLPLHGLLLKEMNWITEMITPTVATQTFHFNQGFANFGDFPIQHTIQIRYELTSAGVIIETAVHNLSKQKMPVSFGFHPYFLIDGNRKDVLLRFDVEESIDTNEFLLPTTKTLPLSEAWNGFQPLRLDHLSFDHGFFISKEKQPAQCSFKDASKKVTIKFEKGYHVMVFYAPNQITKPYLCIEPMVAPTNALLSAHPSFTAPQIDPDETYLAIFEVFVTGHNEPQKP